MIILDDYDFDYVIWIFYVKSNLNGFTTDSSEFKSIKVSSGPRGGVDSNINEISLSR